ARGAQARDRARPGLPLAALHRALRAQHAPALSALTAGIGLSRAARALPGRGRRAGARAHGSGDRAPGAHGAEGLPFARGGRGGSVGLLRVPGIALAEAALDESA